MGGRLRNKVQNHAIEAENRDIRGDVCLYIGFLIFILSIALILIVKIRILYKYM